MAHRPILDPSHLLLLLLLLLGLRLRLLLLLRLIRELRRIELRRAAHESCWIHHGASGGGVGVVHLKEAVAIVVRDSVVHPGAAHGDGADGLQRTATSATKKK